MVAVVVVVVVVVAVVSAVVIVDVNEGLIVVVDVDLWRDSTSRWADYCC